MRDVMRIGPLLSTLGKLWSKFPDLRLGQLIMVLNKGKDPFYLEDDDLITIIAKELKDIEDLTRSASTPDAENTSFTPD